ncbi:MAG: multidrug ABC transporter ATP-binding protein, partial [Gammaproteobacteria bacterium]|nr:multidrug ABC transporter ATP-binding protein [Gammaproteobacteria bacterium]
WQLVRRLRESGVTIILTTHYIEEAEEIADRVGIIDGGRLILVDDKQALMHKLGKKQMVVELDEAVDQVPAMLAPWSLEMSVDGCRLTYTYDPHSSHTGIPDLLQAISAAGLTLKDFNTTQSSLEDIFVNMLKSQ